MGKGTNRSAFFRGEIDKYGWVDIGSSFLPSELNAAFLWAQLENIETIQNRRKEIWELYYNGLKSIDKINIQLPIITKEATNNAHMFYLICNSLDERSGLIKYLNSKKINSVFHYLSLHKSKYYKEKHDLRELKFSDFYTERLLRLPMYYELKDQEINQVITYIYDFYK